MALVAAPGMGLQAREEYILSKVVNNVADEQDDDTFTANEMVDLSVKLTDLVPALDRKAATSSA